MSLQENIQVSAVVTAINSTGDDHQHLVLAVDLPALAPGARLTAETHNTRFTLPLMRQQGSRLESLLPTAQAKRYGIIKGCQLEISIDSEYSLNLEELGQELLIVSELKALAETVFLCDWLRQQQHSPRLVLLGASEALPFKQKPSLLVVDAMPAGVIASMPLLEDWKIASRIAHTAGLPGTYDGPVSELLAYYLDSIPAEQMPEVVVLGQQTFRESVACRMDDKKLRTHHLPVD